MSGNVTMSDGWCLRSGNRIRIWKLIMLSFRFTIIYKRLIQSALVDSKCINNVVLQQRRLSALEKIKSNLPITNAP